MQINRAIIEAAITGFEQQKRQIDETIAELRAQLNGSGEAKKSGSKANVADTPPAQKKRQISAEGRARIAAAQKKRWAEQKKQSVEPKSASKGNRKMSPAAKAKLVANLAKARAAKAANKAKAA
jgi:cell division septum initiation protein DivIVA